MKHLKLTFLLAVLSSIVGANVYAYDIEVANADGVTIYYVWTNNQTELAVSYRGSYSYSYSNEYSGAVNIPESVTYNGKTYPVTSIGNYAFYNTYLKSVTIGSGVLSIGSDAFSHYSSNSSVEGAKPVKVIWLTNTPPSGYENAEGIVNYVANDLYSLSNKTVYPFLSSMFEVDGVKYVPVSPSERTCDAIDCLYDESTENVRIGETVNYRGIDMTVKQVHPYAFYQNFYIKKANLSLRGGVGRNAFYQCSAMTTATLGERVTNLGDYCFSDCAELQDIVIPDAVTGIGKYSHEIKDEANMGTTPISA